MAIATHWDINYSCGHHDTRDLSELPAGKRASRAEWLAKTDCTDCWKSKNPSKVSDEVAAERQAFRDAVVAFAAQYELAPLVGSAAQIDWGTRVRHELLQSTYGLVESGQMTDPDFDALVLTPARMVDRAGWWIDNRECDPTDVAELLADTGLDPAATTTENPL